MVCPKDKGTSRAELHVGVNNHDVSEMSYVHANIYFLIESLFTQNTATISHISLKISKTSVVDMSCLSKCHIPAFNVLLLQATAIGGSGPPGPRTPNRIMGILG